MQKQWTLEMHHPGDGRDSLITTDHFEKFAEVEWKMKLNREMLDDLKRSGLRIERL